MKHTLDFDSKSTDIRSATMKLTKAYEDERTCDLTFDTDSSKIKFYMMESDARQLAEWILTNTKVPKTDL
jgi:hypothetical protein